MAEVETVSELVQISDVASVCDDFEVIEPDVGSPSHRSFHEDFEAEKTPTASPTQSVLLNGMSLDGGSEKSYQISKFVTKEDTEDRPTTPTPDDMGNVSVDLETPIMSESMADFSVTNPKAVLDAVRNLEKMFESHMMGSTITVGGGELASLKEENEELRDQLSTAKKINKRLMDTLEEKSEDIHRLRKAVTKEMTEASAAQIEELMMKLEEAQRQNAVLREKQDGLKNELQISVNENIQLKEKNEALKKIIENVQNESQMVVGSEDQIAALKLDIDHLHAKLAEKEEMIAAMGPLSVEKFGGKPRRNRGRGNSSGIDEEALIVNLRDKHEYINALEIELKQLRNQITNTQIEMANKEAIITVLQEENNEGTRMIVELEQKEKNRRLMDEVRDRHLETGVHNFD